MQCQLTQGSLGDIQHRSTHMWEGKKVQKHMLGGEEAQLHTWGGKEGQKHMRGGDEEQKHTWGGQVAQMHGRRGISICGKGRRGRSINGEGGGVGTHGMCMLDLASF